MANTTQYDPKKVAHAMAVLRANGGNALKTAKQLRIPRTTLRQWASGMPAPRPVPAIPNAELVDDVSAELATKFENAALDALEPEALGVALEKASFKDRVLGAAIAIDKRQLLIGGATSRTETLSVHLVGAVALNAAGSSTLAELLGRRERTDSEQ